MNINNITITGRVVKDSEQRTVGSSDLLRFTVAVNEPRQVNNEWVDHVTYFDCEAWNRKAQLKKGQPVAVSGKMESYDHDGKRYWKLVAFRLDFDGKWGQN